MRRKKTFIILMIVCFIAAVFVIKKMEENSIEGYLKGSYTSEQLPFNLFSFDTENNHTFSYYYSDQPSHTQAVKKGTFYKKEKNVYVLESEYFNDTEIVFNKHNSFLIKINNQEYTFIQLGRNTTTISHVEDK